MIAVDGGESYEVKYMQECIILFVLCLLLPEEPSLVFSASPLEDFHFQANERRSRERRETLHLHDGPNLPPPSPFLPSFQIYFQLEPPKPPFITTNYTSG